jgi:hypothetical protein
MGSEQALVLDPALRIWVFLPLTACIVLMKLIQQYAHVMIHGTPAKQNKELPEIAEQQSVARSQRVRAAHRFIPETSYNMRKQYFATEETGLFHQKVKSRTMNEAMATDPSMAIDMMKKASGGGVGTLGQQGGRGLRVQGGRRRRPCAPCIAMRPMHRHAHGAAPCTTLTCVCSTHPAPATCVHTQGASGMVPQFAMGWVVNFFFSGFVMGKIPFPLSPRFKVRFRVCVCVS